MKDISQKSVDEVIKELHALLQQDKLDDLQIYQIKELLGLHFNYYKFEEGCGKNGQLIQEIINKISQNNILCEFIILNKPEPQPDEHYDKESFLGNFHFLFIRNPEYFINVLKESKNKNSLNLLATALNELETYLNKIDELAIAAIWRWERKDERELGCLLIKFIFDQEDEDIKILLNNRIIKRNLSRWFKFFINENDDEKSLKDIAIHILNNFHLFLRIQKRNFTLTLIENKKEIIYQDEILKILYGVENKEQLFDFFKLSTNEKKIELLETCFLLGNTDIITELNKNNCELKPIAVSKDDNDINIESIIHFITQKNETDKVIEKIKSTFEWIEKYVKNKESKFDILKMVLNFYHTKKDDKTPVIILEKIFYWGNDIEKLNAFLEKPEDFLDKHGHLFCFLNECTCPDNQRMFDRKNTNYRQKFENLILDNVINKIFDSLKNNVCKEFNFIELGSGGLAQTFILFARLLNRISGLSESLPEFIFNIALSERGRIDKTKSLAFLELKTKLDEIKKMYNLNITFHWSCLNTEEDFSDQAKLNKEAKTFGFGIDLDDTERWRGSFNQLIKHYNIDIFFIGAHNGLITLIKNKNKMQLKDTIPWEKDGLFYTDKIAEKIKTLSQAENKIEIYPVERIDVDFGLIEEISMEFFCNFMSSLNNKSVKNIHVNLLKKYEKKALLEFLQSFVPYKEDCLFAKNFLEETSFSKDKNTIQWFWESYSRKDLKPLTKELLIIILPAYCDELYSEYKTKIALIKETLSENDKITDILCVLEEGKDNEKYCHFLHISKENDTYILNKEIDRNINFKPSEYAIEEISTHLAKQKSTCNLL